MVFFVSTGIQDHGGKTVIWAATKTHVFCLVPKITPNKGQNKPVGQFSMQNEIL